MLLAPQTSAGASKVLLLRFDVSVLSFRLVAFCLFMLYCFVLSHLSPGGRTTPLFYQYFSFFLCFFVPLLALSTSVFLGVSHWWDRRDSILLDLLGENTYVVSYT